MTLQDLIISVTDNIGNRSDGRIGSSSVDAAILNGVNKALPQCVKLSDPEYYNKTLQITIPVGSPTEIALPDVVEDSSSYKIKDITHHRTSRSSDGTGINVVKKTWTQFLILTSDYDQQLGGIPSVLAFREGNLYINRVPEEEYNLTLFVEVWPRILSSSDLNIQLPINNEWELALESFTTYYCFLKLQQMTQANFWKGLYEDQKETNTQQGRKTNIRGQGMGGITYSGNPQLNPFVTSFNS